MLGIGIMVCNVPPPPRYHAAKMSTSSSCDPAALLV
jgi:hypothetical protein